MFLKILLTIIGIVYILGGIEAFVAAARIKDNESLSKDKIEDGIFFIVVGVLVILSIIFTSIMYLFDNVLLLVLVIAIVATIIKKIVFKNKN